MTGPITSTVVKPRHTSCLLGIRFKRIVEDVDRGWNPDARPDNDTWPYVGELVQAYDDRGRSISGTTLRFL